MKGSGYIHFFSRREKQGRKGNMIQCSIQINSKPIPSLCNANLHETFKIETESINSDPAQQVQVQVQTQCDP